MSREDELEMIERLDMLQGELADEKRYAALGRRVVEILKDQANACTTKPLEERRRGILIAAEAKGLGLLPAWARPLDTASVRREALTALGEKLARQLPALEALASQPRNACVGDKSDALRLIADATRAAVGLGTAHAVDTDREHDEAQDRRAVGGSERTHELSREMDEDQGRTGRAY